MIRDQSLDPNGKLTMKLSQPQLLTVVLLLGLLGVAAACSSGSPSSTHIYQVKGRVVSIPPEKQSVVIDHEDIPGFMQGMTMSFPVKDPGILKDLTANDLINFELTVPPQDSWVSRIEKTGHTEESESSVNKGAAAVAVESILRVGQKAPAFSLIDQDGRHISLKDFRGKPVAITFIFTRCPLPDYCPRFTSHFAAVQKKLMPQYPGQFHLISVSIDPEHDTPAVLKDFAQRFGADFQIWSWLTGPAKTIREVTAPYGVRYWNEDETISHSSACAVIDPAGQVYKLYWGNTWTPDEIISDLTTLLAKRSDAETDPSS